MSDSAEEEWEVTRDFYHEHPFSGALRVQLPGCKSWQLSWVGRPDHDTVALYAVNPANPMSRVPVFEVDADYFEVVLEQASGALMDAQADSMADRPSLPPELRGPSGPGEEP